MPLPAALLARLAKRGIVNTGKPRENPEETFAEDYSEKDDQSINPDSYEYQSSKRDDNVWTEKLKRRFKETTRGVKGCPNKWNVHHVCTVFCLERWGEGHQKPSKKYRERFARLLERYPLPKNWVFVWDQGCAYYFWNKNDNTVSWLPPKHPKAVIGKSAATIRSEKDRPDLDNMEDEPPIMPPSRAPLDIQMPPPMEDRYQRPAPIQKKTKSRDLEKILRTKKGRKQYHENSDKIDPMDPASYSDCGRGKWSSGMNVDEGRTGVDSTASGQLFQQRPYPSPGDVLRANQAKRQDQDDTEDTHKRRRYSEDD